MGTKILRHQDLIVYKKAMDRKYAKQLYLEYDEIISILFSMQNKPNDWVLLKSK